MFTKFIADIGSNHNRNYDRLLRLVDGAAEAGCYGIKLQIFKAEELYHPSCEEDLIEKTKLGEFPIEWIDQISQYVRYEKNLAFGCTPFSEDMVDIVFPYVDFLKISSFDTRRISLIKKCTETNLPLIISIGLATETEISEIYRTCAKAHFSNEDPLTNVDNLIFLYCISKYPTRPDECNLKRIENLSSIYAIPIGWSDHTCNEAVIYSAIKNNADVIEVHIDLPDMEGFESSSKHCWDINNLKRVIDTSRLINIAEGNGLFPCNHDRIKEIEETRKEMADSIDGLRPLKEYRRT